MAKQLFRSQTNKMIGGICGGIGEYIDVDPTMIRLLYAFVTLITAILPCIIFYIIMLFVVPTKVDYLR